MLLKEFNSLKDQLNRSFIELKAYQEKYPSIHIKDYEKDDNLPPWITSSDVMTPLLQAYDTSNVRL
jgi:hypothetical protein